jgi:hypothetical protein
MTTTKCTGRRIATQSPDTDWEMAQAKACADYCDRLIGRLMFWMNWLDIPVVGRFAEMVADNIAADIGNTTAAIERWIEIINQRRLTAGHNPAT